MLCLNSNEIIISFDMLNYNNKKFQAQIEAISALHLSPLKPSLVCGISCERVLTVDLSCAISPVLRGFFFGYSRFFFHYKINAN